MMSGGAMRRSIETFKITAIVSVQPGPDAKLADRIQEFRKNHL